MGQTSQYNMTVFQQSIKIANNYGYGAGSYIYSTHINTHLVLEKRHEKKNYHFYILQFFILKFYNYIYFLEYT